MRNTQRHTNAPGLKKRILIKAAKYIQINRKSRRISLPIEKTGQNYELVTKKTPERKQNI